MWFWCVDEGWRWFCLCPQPGSGGSGGTGCPSPSSAASSGIPEVLLGRDALPEAALLVLMQPQGKGRDEDTDVVPELTEKKKIRWNTRLLLQFLLKWETRSV